METPTRPQSEGDDFSGLEADAICEQCETVNPPGVIACQGCGSDLRAQHARRLEQLGAIEVTQERIQPIRVLTGLIAVLGALICVWAALNMDTLVVWMARGFTDPTGGREIPPREFWEGREAAPFDALLAELLERPITGSEIRAGGVGVENGFEGRYFIQPLVRIGDPPVIGYALVREANDGLRLVARFSDRMEIRAELEVRGDILISAHAAARTSQGYLAVMGYAEPQPNGSLLCSGQTLVDEGFYQVVARRVP